MLLLLGEPLAPARLTAEIMCEPIEVHLLVRVKQLKLSLADATLMQLTRVEVTLLAALTTKVNDLLRSALHLVGEANRKSLTADRAVFLLTQS